jgi:hypothetical protein
MDTGTDKLTAEAKTKHARTTVAIAEDKMLAKDYQELLIANEIPAEIEKHDQDNQGNVSYSINVAQEQSDKAVEVILSRCPGEYFYASLFGENVCTEDETQENL